MIHQCIRAWVATTLMLVGIGVGGCSRTVSAVIAPPAPLARSTVPHVAVCDDLWSETILFAHDSAVLPPEAPRALERCRQWLDDHPDGHLLIEGHADERGADEDNFALGERRAQTVGQRLESLGVDPGQLRLRSWGETRPVVEGHSEAAWRLNRRVQLVPQTITE